MDNIPRIHTNIYINILNIFNYRKYIYYVGKTSSGYTLFLSIIINSLVYDTI